MSDLQRAPLPHGPRGTRDDDAPRYTLATVLATIPTTKRSQVELLVRTQRITPAWPSAGTGHDRAFDRQNLFEISLAAELMRLGLEGDQLAKRLPSILDIVLDPKALRGAEYLVLIPGERGPMPLPGLASRAELERRVGSFPSAYVLNVRNILSHLEVALATLKSGQK